jgi:hypothetical protein
MGQIGHRRQRLFVRFAARAHGVTGVTNKCLDARGASWYDAPMTNPRITAELANANALDAMLDDDPDFADFRRLVALANAIFPESDNA